MRSMRGANRLDHRLFDPVLKHSRISVIGAFEIGDRGLAAVQRGKHVDQHDLAVEPREMIAEERPHHMGLIGLVAPLHHGEERAARKALASLRVERGEGERGRPFKIARHEEAPGGSVESASLSARVSRR